MHELLGYLFTPGLILGGLLGLALVLLANWLLPSLSPIVGAVVSVFFCILGIVFEAVVSRPRKD